MEKCQHSNWIFEMWDTVDKLANARGTIRQNAWLDQLVVYKFATSLMTVLYVTNHHWNCSYCSLNQCMLTYFRNLLAIKCVCNVVVTLHLYTFQPRSFYEAKYQEDKDIEVSWAFEEKEAFPNYFVEKVKNLRRYLILNIC